jgi:hypothetical protein
MNCRRILSFDELPPYPLISFTNRNEQVRADEAQSVIVCDGDQWRKVLGVRKYEELK